MIQRHYRVWLKSADGLTGPKGIMRIPSGFKYSYRTSIIKKVDHQIYEDSLWRMEFQVLDRTYEYWKQEGRKLWYREVVK